MSKTVTIPTDGMNPFVVIHNGEKYVYTPGATVTVPDGVALEIEEYKRWRSKYFPKDPAFIDTRPDLTQNDPTAADFVKGRTHYEDIMYDNKDQMPVKIDPHAIDDGYHLVNRCSSEGRSWFEAWYGYRGIKETGTGQKICLAMEFTTGEPWLLDVMSATSSTIELIDSKNYKINNFLGYYDIYVIVQRNALSEENKINFPEHGIYIKPLKDAYKTWTSLSAVLVWINQINSKFIPSSIARKADVVPTPATAEVGQTIIVKSVDSAGKPTEWEAVDLPSGGGENTVMLSTFAELEEEQTGDTTFNYYINIHMDRIPNENAVVINDISFSFNEIRFYYNEEQISISNNSNRLFLPDWFTRAEIVASATGKKHLVFTDVYCSFDGTNFYIILSRAARQLQSS